MSTYNIDDILNANDSDEDVDTMSVDLEKLLDDDDDDDDNDVGIVSRESGQPPMDLHLYSDSDDEDDEGEGQLPMPPRPDELFAHDSFNPNTHTHGNASDAELDEILREDSPPLPSSTEASAHFASSTANNALTHNHPLHTLQLAEKREQRHMYTGDKDTMSALQSKLESKVNADITAHDMNSSSESEDKSDGIHNEAISHFKCVCLEMVSTQLHRNSQFKQHGPGIATVVKFTPKFIALGTTRGLVLIFDHNQEMRQVIGSSVPTAGRNVYAISALDVSVAGDLVFCGYENGEIIVWDISKGSVIKRITDLHTVRIVKLCLVYGIGEEAASITGISNEYSVISVDAKGVVNKIKMSKSMFLAVSIDSECLLDGSAGSIQDMSAMLPFSTLTSFPAIVTGEDDVVTGKSTSMSTPSGAVAVITDCPAYIPRTDQYIALNSSVRSYIIRVYPQVKIVYRWTAPADIAQRKREAVMANMSPPTTESSPNETPPSAKTNTVTTTPPSVSLDWTWMPAPYYSELKVASSNAKSILNPTGPLIHPVLVRGWGTAIEILALVPPTSTATASSISSSSGGSSGVDVEAILLASHQLPHDIITVKWLSNHTSVVVMTTHEVLVLNVPSFSAERLPVTKEVSEILSQHVIARSQDTMPPLSICVSRERMYLLATDKMYMFYLQSWQEQAEQLLGEGQWLDALALVLDRYQPLRDTLSGAQLEKEEGFLRDYIKRYAELAIMRSADVSMGGPLSFPASLSRSSLSSDGSAARGKSSSHHFLVASICIEYCLIAGGSLMTDMLFGEIYAEFTSAQHQSIFMDALEPFTLRRQITDIPTKVFSDLVEYCNRSQQYSLLERMVCHLDLTDIDMDSLVRSLKRARLHSGFLYVHAYGLNDFSGAFLSVFEDMLLSTSRGKEVGMGGSSYQFPTPQQVDVGYKIILFIQYSASGQVFPRGGKTVVSAPCLTQLVELLISKTYPPVPISTSTTSAASATGGGTLTPAALTSPQMNFSYPFLFSLAQIDLYALFHTLAQAFKAIYGNSDNGNIVKLNNNNLYFASFGAMFGAVLSFAKYADTQAGSSGLEVNADISGIVSSKGSSSQNITHQLCFFDLFVELITSCNVCFSLSFLCSVIQHCQRHITQPSCRAESLVNSLVTRQMKYLLPKPEVYRALAMELEQNYFFITALKLCTVSSKYRYKPTPDTLRTAIVCYVRHKTGLTHCVPPTTDSNSGPGTGDSDSAMKIFSYIHEFFDHLDNTTASDAKSDYSCCCRVLIDFIQELSGVDLHSTQLLMVMYLHEYVELMMEKTKKQQRLQFDLLDAMVRGVCREPTTSLNLTTSTASEGVQTSEEINEFGQAVDGTVPIRNDSEQDATPQASTVKEVLHPATSLNDKNILVFISQLATFQPKQVLNFLSTHSNYPLDDALIVCKQKSIFNATAYLLERAGDSMSALELCLMEINNTLPVFVQRVEQMVSEALQQNQGSSGVSVVSNTRQRGVSISVSGSGMTFGKSMTLLQLLKNPSPSKLIEVFQHLEEFSDFNEIVHMLTGICSRIDSTTSSSYSHWFHVLDQLLKVKHSLNSSNNGNRTSLSVRESILQDLSSHEGDTQMAKELVGLVLGQALKVFMSQMGGTVPSQDIVRRITQKEMMGSRFSEFKDVMVSMVDSYSYEIALYKTCLRITTSDLLLLRARRMKQNHMGVRHHSDASPASALLTAAPSVSPTPVDSPDELLPPDLLTRHDKSFQPVNHRSADSTAGGLAHRRPGSHSSHGMSLKEAFTGTANLIDMAARVVISTELPAQAELKGFEQANADMEGRIPGSLPIEASFVASYQGF